MVEKNTLLKDVAVQTGLPYDSIYGELSHLVEKSGQSEDNLTVEGLREIVAEYLQDLIAELSE